MDDGTTTLSQPRMSRPTYSDSTMALHTTALRLRSFTDCLDQQPRGDGMAATYAHNGDFVCAVASGSKRTRENRAVILRVIVQ